ncbi:MAG: cation transporter [Alphaproteobacteria bacterium]|nr:cation transporter [Alphaproteobacteria bacterium]MBP7758618.1 cation transporter [Alphaproteobacteria bacterium]MBP7763363.1 cation transporter [Alphaproteobacteria bacterium]MBP7904962.1 cation transporter [Alphaproteobacteria bacterium]
MSETERPQQPIEPRYALYAGYASIAIVIVLIFAKSLAYYASGSSSVLSSLTDSIMDSFVSLMALGSIYYAQRPADEDHRWGHGKMEGVSALFQAAVIFAAGFFLVLEAASRFLAPAPIGHHALGIAVMVFSIALSVLLVWIQRLSLKKAPSLAVEADSAHYGSDILINAGVMLVLILTANGAPIWIDPLFTVMVAAMMAAISRKIGGKAVDMLLDRELPDSERRRLIEIIAGHEGVKGWHDLRTTRHGMGVVVSVDIEVAADLSLRAAHDIARQVESKILLAYPHAEILIHVDPEGDTDDTRHKVQGIHT